MMKSLGCRSISNFPMFNGDEVAFLRLKPTIDVISEYFGCDIFLLCVKNCSVEDHLTNLSKLAHLGVVLHRNNRTKFMPNQSYASTQRMVRAIYTSVMVAKHENINEAYIHLESDNLLGMHFNIVRSMYSGCNFDTRGFQERTTDAMVVQNIFAERPELDGGYRMVKTGVRGAAGEGLATEDHMTPNSYLRVDEAAKAGKSQVVDWSRVTTADCDIARAW